MLGKVTTHYEIIYQTIVSENNIASEVVDVTADPDVVSEILTRYRAEYLYRLLVRVFHHKRGRHTRKELGEYVGVTTGDQWPEIDYFGGGA